MPEKTDNQNIFQKLQSARAKIADKKLKKTGKNLHTKAEYYELGDFMPAVNAINDELGLYSRFNIQPAKNGQKERAVLVIVNTEKPEEKETFYSDTAEVSIQGGQAIQSLGGKLTYMRRYMYMIAYEISEGDQIDSREPEVEGSKYEITDDEISQIEAAKDMKELAAIGKKLQDDLGANFRPSIIKHYTARKNALEKKAVAPAEDTQEAA